MTQEQWDKLSDEEKTERIAYTLANAIAPRNPSAGPLVIIGIAMLGVGFALALSRIVS